MARICLSYLFCTAVAVVTAVQPARAAEIPYTVERCEGSAVASHPKMIQALAAIYSITGKKPVLTSCSRNWSKNSQHRTGVAVDLKVPGYTGTAMCELLNKVRDTVIGHGGIGNYYGARSHIGHIDLRVGRVAWDRCKGMFGSPDTYRSRRVESYWDRVAPQHGFSGDFRENRGGNN